MATGDRRARSRDVSAGFTLVETLVALLLGGLVVHAAWALLRVHAAAGAGVVAVGRRAAAGALVHGLLGRELRAGVAGRDVSMPAEDTLGLRVYRGTALACSGSGPLVVRYRGLRRPDPAKDSVLVLDRLGRWVPAALEWRAGSDPSACASALDWKVEEWRISEEVEGPPVALRLFERGSYHVADAALRYRRGRSGRQPLVPEVLAEASRLRAGPAGAVRVHLYFEGEGVSSDPDPWTGTHWPREVR